MMNQSRLNKHCSECKHFWSNSEVQQMYCKKLQRRITARKRPCKHFNNVIDMIEESYVGFDTARMLKEAGFLFRLAFPGMLRPAVGNP